MWKTYLICSPEFGEKLHKDERYKKSDKFDLCPQSFRAKNPCIKIITLEPQKINEDRFIENFVNLRKDKYGKKLVCYKKKIMNI